MPYIQRLNILLLPIEKWPPGRWCPCARVPVPVPVPVPVCPLFTAVYLLACIMAQYTARHTSGLYYTEHTTRLYTTLHFTHRLLLACLHLNMISEHTAALTQLLYLQSLYLHSRYLQKLVHSGEINFPFPLEVPL